jgi:hypothetical protein
MNSPLENHEVRLRGLGGRTACGISRTGASATGSHDGIGEQHHPRRIASVPAEPQVWRLRLLLRKSRSVPNRHLDPRDTRVREALVLRRWALPALCGAEEPAPAVSQPGWSTFIRAERCALALLALGDALLGDGAALVRRRASVETQRVLSAGAQLHLLAKLARRDGAMAVVLKGGVPLAEGRSGADLVDVDVLAPAPQAEALGAALDAGGFTPYGRTTSHRLRERAVPNAVQVELHTGVPSIGSAEAFVQRAIPARLAGLRVPHPADHLWHLLLHSVVQHTGRRGSLRELVVLADALGRCAPEDVAGVQARIARRRDGAALHTQLALAESLRARRPPPDDPFREMAAARYTIAEYLGPSQLSMRFKGPLMEAVFLTIARRAGTGPTAADAEEGEDRAGPVRALLRRVPEWVLKPPALLFARRARRLAEGGGDGGV